MSMIGYVRIDAGGLDSASAGGGCGVSGGVGLVCAVVDAVKAGRLGYCCGDGTGRITRGLPICGGFGGRDLGYGTVA
ncbi:hypothetical protein [Catenuloplanes atrovinosus]|uniref:Uncharacterized protein n=1 Tax=Catenuloplanes atrovinosus TaxID=137266 RepID=A0AAE3YQE4_9ACTN|nr:hypothetical protein [Catenuloplanes atrovinosus]MDR7277760.1 hypothetical protein [Catenuloplanes atrovinosus]